MEMALRYGGNWLRDRQPSTGSSLWNGLMTSVVVSTSSAEALAESYRWVEKHWIDSTFSLNGIAGERTPAEDLQRIRDILSPGMLNLAIIFGVSRQAIYNWLNGEQPRPEHLAKLKDFAQAADFLAEAGIALTGAVLKRPVIDGKNLFEIAQGDNSIQDAAKLLVQAVKREMKQRERLTNRFAGRKVVSRSVESDFPAINDIR
jgi:transcriptional regulator with XRE-family HTH domain